MANNYSSSSSFQEPDEISLFLQQILLRSSSSAPVMRQQSFAAPSDDHLLAANQEAEMVPGHAQISVSSGLNPSSSSGFAVANVSSSSVGNLDNELDECDYESEEVVEALVDETAPKSTPHRSSSKRSRAAEVHNLSEKRRRSRINEKMKALQNLIPNSNKTDKASMLDEAIEYLKQLQLQVQMLTMRNGLSLYPICLPGMLQPNQTSQIRIDVYESDKLVTKAVSMDQNISAPVTDVSRMIGSKSSLEVHLSMQQHQPSLELQSCMPQHHYGALELSGSSKGICEKKVLHCRPLIEDHPQSSSGVKATSSIPCQTQISNLKGNIVEACQAGGDHLLPNFVNNPIFSSQLNM